MKVHLTDRAFDELEEIYDRSVQEWGVDIADEYLDGLQNTFDLLSDYPNVLRTNAKLSPHFSFYPYRRHMLVCYRKDQYILILSILYTGMNLLNRINSLTPTLKKEMESLYLVLAKSTHP